MYTHDLYTRIYVLMNVNTWYNNWLYRTDICHISIGIPLAYSAKDVSSRKQNIHTNYYKKHM